MIRRRKQVELGIYWRRNELVIVKSQGGTESNQFHAFTIKVSDSIVGDPQQIGELIRQQLRSEGLHATNAAVALPLSEAVVHRLRIPPADDAEIAELVRFQLESNSSLPFETLAYDFLPRKEQETTSGQSVIAVAYLKERLDLIAAAAHAAGLNLRRVGIAGLAAADMLAEGASIGDEAGDANLLLCKVGRSVEVVEFDADGVRFLKAASQRQGETTIDALARISRHALLQSGSGASRSQQPVNLLCLADEIDEQASTELGRLLPMARVTSPMLMPHGRLPFDGHARFAEVAASGMLLSGAETNVPNIDLVNPRKRERSTPTYWPKLAAVAVATLIIAAGLVRVRLRAATLDGQIAQLTSQLREAETGLSGSQPVMLSADAIDDWAVQQVNWRQTIASVQEAFPLGRVDLDRWRCTSTGGTVEMELEGKAASRATVQAIGHRLAAQPMIRVQPPSSTTEANGRFPEAFRMKIFVDTSSTPLAPASTTPFSSQSRPALSSSKRSGEIGI